MKREGFNNLERGLKENLDMDFIYQVLNLIPQKPRALKKTKRSFD
jgi:hypothetical protein